MNKLPPFAEREIAVTMTGAQWFALVARITHSTPKRGLFSEEGRAIYRAAGQRLNDQLSLASTTHERAKLGIVK
jgi:hypothetical protein